MIGINYKIYLQSLLIGCFERPGDDIPIRINSCALLMLIPMATAVEASRPKDSATSGSSGAGILDPDSSIYTNHNLIV